MVLLIILIITILMKWVCWKNQCKHLGGLFLIFRNIKYKEILLVKKKKRNILSSKPSQEKNIDGNIGQSSEKGKVRIKADNDINSTLI